MKVKIKNKKIIDFNIFQNFLIDNFERKKITNIKNKIMNCEKNPSGKKIITIMTTNAINFKLGFKL